MYYAKKNKNQIDGKDQRRDIDISAEGKSGGSPVNDIIKNAKNGGYDAGK
jgi:hypothetical protein